MLKGVNLTSQTIQCCDFPLKQLPEEVKRQIHLLVYASGHWPFMNFSLAEFESAQFKFFRYPGPHPCFKEDGGP